MLPPITWRPVWKRRAVPHFANRVLARQVFRFLCALAIIAAFSSSALSRAEDEQSLNKDLMAAAKNGDAASVKLLLEKGADPNARVFGTWLNFTPLIQAIEEGHCEAAEALLNYGANPYLEDENNDPALVFAASKEHEEELKLLLKWKVPIDGKNSNGITALARNAPFSPPEDLQVLVDHGANPNQSTKDGTTLLMRVADEESDAATKALIKAGAKLDARNEAGNTALMVSAGGAYHGSVKALVEAGANVNLSNNDGLTPLMAMIGAPAGLDRFLLDHGADIKAKSKAGLTTLMIAAQRGNVEFAKRAIAAGVDVNAQDDSGESALSMAAGYSWFPYKERTDAALRETALKILSLLLQAGADARHANQYGLTALHQACVQGYSGTVKQLLESGLNPNQASKTGMTPLHFVVSSRAMDAVRTDALDKARALLAGGASVNTPDEKGHTPLWLAVAQMDHELAALFLENGATVDQTDKTGETLLNTAARSFHEKFVPPKNYEWILISLAKKAKTTDMPDSRGMTPLMWAAASDSSAVLEALLARSAGINAHGKDGRTPLMWAAAAGATHAIQALLRHGADIAAKDNQGRTASDWADWMDQKEALALLKGRGQ